MELLELRIAEQYLRYGRGMTGGNEVTIVENNLGIFKLFTVP